MGCAVDNISGVRLLNEFVQLEVAGLTVEACQATCASKGYAYAGLEDGDECMCGNSLSGTQQWTGASCNTPCSGDATGTCGGSWALQVYHRSGDPVLIVTPTATGETATIPTVVTTATAITTASLITTTSTSTSTTTVPSAIPSSSAEHYVWAHHMVGNTYPYSQATWAGDIAMAKAQGIDGFALNVGSDSWEAAHVKEAYQAAEADGSFKMFLSLDMSAFGCSSATHASQLVSLVQSVASSSAQAMYNGKVLVSTFSGESCTFGTGSINGWKTLFKDALTSAGVPIYFMPSFFVNSGGLAAYDWLDGGINWSSAWPMGDYDITASSSDSTYLTGLGSKTYMTTVSPFFFTHFGPNTWNKNWIYRSDDWLYCSRWEQIIYLRDKSPMTEILTWNDYGESSYVGPIDGELPVGSSQWVNRYEHTGLATLTSYYATAFKTGAYPTIKSDSITLWSRSHPASAVATSDSLGRPAGWEWTDDNLYAVVLATAAGSVTLTSGSTSQTFDVAPGLNKLKIPSAVGTIGATLTRNGATVVQYSAGTAFSFVTNPTTYNYNYFVGSASA
jgi:glucan endo-1,3-alpha-glucosidase